MMVEKVREQYELINESIQSTKEKLESHEGQLRLLQTYCEHPNMENDAGSPHCPDCGYRSDGPFCQNSPVKECHYYNTETGEYNEGQCIYCSTHS